VRTMAINEIQSVHRRRVGLTPAEPIPQKSHRLVLAAERQVRPRKREITSWPSRSDRLARATALIVVLLSSLGLWAAIWGGVASLASAVLG
jgi:hypothetical protein